MLTKQYVWGEGIDECVRANLPDVADIDGDMNTTEKVDLYYHHNSLGSVVAVTDINGTVKESYRYTAFGKHTIFDKNGAEVATSQVEQPFMWTGARFDFEEGSGLYQMRLRYYDPVAGRFVSRDPLGLWGDASQNGNGQGYCGHNPINRVDPRGLTDEEFERERRGQASGDRPRNKALDSLEDALDKEEEAREAAEAAQGKAERARQRHEDTQHELDKKQKRRSLNEAEKLADDARDRARDAERAREAVEEALERVAKDGEAAGALRKAGPRIWERLGRLAKAGKRIGKLFPGLGALLAVLFFGQNVYAKGPGGAVADGLTDAIPILGTGKGMAELVTGVDMIPDLDDPRRRPKPVCGGELGGLIDEPLRGDVAAVGGGSRTR